MWTKRMTRALTLLPLGLLAACASMPENKPDDALAKADFAVEQARQDAAGQYAAKVLYTANQKLQSAQQLVNDEDATEESYALARRLAEEATVDAQLASARSNAKQAQAQAEQVETGITTLKQNVTPPEVQQ